MYKKPKGTQDIFGERQEYRTFVLQTLETVVKFYNFKRMDTPIFESLDLFKRSVGDSSDIVNKEMYNFIDKKGRELVLRPEGTAPIIRSFIENKLFTESQPSKFYYVGPMFRYERPQKGRQRQFSQFGIELIGINTPESDVEVIMLGNQILNSLKIKKFKLLINSIGDEETKRNYKTALKEYFLKYKEQLTEDSIKRIETNPLRILDDKVDSKKDFVLNAPKISKFYSEKSKIYLEKVQKLLEIAKIKNEVSEKLVRGLDYYSEIIFEFISTSQKAGSQSTIIGGGRYNNLINQLGGPKMSAVGFGLGIERLVNEIKNINLNISSRGVDLFVVNLNNKTMSSTNSIAYMLRLAGFNTEYTLKPVNLNKAFEKAKKIKSKFIIIVGPKNLSNDCVSVKHQKTGNQDCVKIPKLVNYFNKKIGTKSWKK